ncbi:hypothetical protein V6Z11_A11G196300 [Gossypium hirsutum]
MMKRFWIKAWWVLEELFERKVKRIWKTTSGDIFAKLKSLRNDLGRLAGFVISKREDFKRDLIRKLEEMMEKEKYDENQVELVNTKIQLNLKIDKDKVYWEKKAHANWLRLRDKNIAFFHNFASQHKRMDIIICLKHDDGRETRDEGEMEEIA